MSDEQRQLPTLQEIINDNRRSGVGVLIEEYTCYECPLWQSCEFAFAGYNTDGDCLAEK